MQQVANVRTSELDQDEAGTYREERHVALALHEKSAKHRENQDDCQNNIGHIAKFNISDSKQSHPQIGHMTDLWMWQDDGDLVADFDIQSWGLACC